jgi:hypothetical protein
MFVEWKTNTSARYNVMEASRAIAKVRDSVESGMMLVAVMREQGLSEEDTENREFETCFEENLKEKIEK